MVGVGHRAFLRVTEKNDQLVSEHLRRRAILFGCTLELGAVVAGAGQV